MKKHCRIYNEPPPLSEDPTVAQYQKFLVKLQKHLEIYNNFINNAVFSKILNIKECKASEYYYRYIHFSNNKKLSNIPKDSFVEDSESSSQVISSQSSRFDAYNIQKNLAKQKFMNFASPQRMNSSKKEKSTRPRSKRRKNIIQKKMILNRTKPKLINLFQNMCGTPSTALKSCRITNYLFKAHLQKKFPIEMVEAICKYFDFKSANFDDYCAEMDRFILGGDEKHLSLCFDAFDLNKDKYICYKDTYSAIEIRKDNIYDSDLIKIEVMFEMKKRGKIIQKKNEPHKGRRMSVMSLSSEVSGFDEESTDGKEKKVPYIHPDKPEAITLDDFKRIEFKAKPQLLRTFFLYTCNFDIERFSEVQTPAVKSRKQSQDIIIEMSQTNDLEPKEEKSKYLSDLENAMGLFPFAETKDLLEKFEILRDKHSPDFKTISKASMLENWPKLFGARCDYVSERIYSFFAGPKFVDITKARFLTMINSVRDTDLSIKMFSFNVYDQRADGKITPDEIYKMEQALPSNSLIYKECMM